MERTLALIKPDGLQQRVMGAILKRLEESGFEIKGAKLLYLSGNQVERFYAVHRGKDFFDDLVLYMSSGPVMAVVLQGHKAVGHLRTLMGATDPKEAADGTLRRLYGTSKQRNVIHGSDSDQNAEKEIRNQILLQRTGTRLIGS
jgi:nucleoside-diphosphate kinase